MRDDVYYSYALNTGIFSKRYKFSRSQVTHLPKRQLVIQLSYRFVPFTKDTDNEVNGHSVTAGINEFTGRGRAGGLNAALVELSKPFATQHNR